MTDALLNADGADQADLSRSRQYLYLVLIRIDLPYPLDPRSNYFWA
ncbi:MAG: hypothetical protein ACKVQJ_09635 [Pyrinomonadaceae bacterium]